MRAGQKRRDLTEREVNAIVDQLEGTLALSPADAQEMLAQARWLTREMKDLGTVLHRAAPHINDDCTAQEKAELFDMLTAVGQADGSIDEIQQDALDRLRRDLGLNRR